MWDADGEVVNIYVRNTAERTGFCLVDSGAKIVVVQNQEQLDKLFQVMDAPFVVEGHEDQAEYETTLQLEKLITINPITIPPKYTAASPRSSNRRRKSWPDRIPRNEYSLLVDRKTSRISFTPRVRAAHPKGSSVLMARRCIISAWWLGAV